MPHAGVEGPVGGQRVDVRPALGEPDAQGPPAREAQEEEIADAKEAEAPQQPVAERVAGMQAFLQRHGVRPHAGAILAWCDAMGLAFLSEVKENVEELVAAVGATGVEGEELREAAAGIDSEDEEDAEAAAACGPEQPSAAVAAPADAEALKVAPLPRASTLLHPEVPRAAAVKESRSTVARTRTSPVTAPEVSAAANRAARAYVPLGAWPMRQRRSVVQERVPSTVPSASRHVADIVQEEAQPLTREELLVESTEDPTDSRRARLRQRKENWITPHWKTCRCCRVDSWLLRQPLPPPEALANPFLAAIEEEEAKFRGERSCQRPSFEGLRKSILAEHREEIASGLKKVFKNGYNLVPARVAPEVQSRFVEGYMSCGSPELLPATHGSRAENYTSILERGLLLPGKQNEIRVVNGSAHGKGIYTAHVGAAWLSRTFCSEPRMLLCAVVNDAVDVWGQQKLIRGRPVTAASAAVKHVGDAMVIFDECRVAPLCLAEEKEAADEAEDGAGAAGPWRRSGPLPTANRGLKEKLAARKMVRVGTRQVLHRPSGQRAFEPPVADQSDSRRRVLQKRHYERRLRDVARAMARDAQRRRDALVLPGEAER